MKLLFLILLPLIFVNTIYSKFNFRGIEFGMNEQQVRNIETSNFLYSDSSNSLVFIDSLFFEPVYVVYLFDENKTVITMSYLFVNNTGVDEWYYLLFENCKQYLTSQYGDCTQIVRENNSMFFRSNSWSDLMASIKWKTGIIAHYWYLEDVSIVLGIFPSGYFDKSLIVICKENRR